jgi:hypothetical protein
MEEATFRDDGVPCYNPSDGISAPEKMRSYEMHSFETASLTGFIVVRLPDRCVTDASRTAYQPISTRYGALRYGGVDRMRWYDVSDGFYTKRLPAALADTFRTISDADHIVGFRCCRDGAEARALLTYANRRDRANELIAVRSPTLALLFGTTASNVEIEWIGYDILSLGWWSLLHDGLFLRPALFTVWEQYLNPHGLATDSITADYAAAYCAAAAGGGVEPLPTDPIFDPTSTDVGTIFAVEVGRVREAQYRSFETNNETDEFKKSSQAISEGENR